MKSLKDKESRVKLKFSDDKVNICHSKDVKQAVLGFEKYLNIILTENYKDKPLTKELYENTYKHFFGDWEK